MNRRLAEVRLVGVPLEEALKWIGDHAGVEIATDRRDGGLL